MTDAQPLTLVPLLPAPEPALRMTRVIVADDGAVVLEVRTVGREVRCPACHQLTARVQSRYRRTLADLAAQGVPVRVRVEVRRFRCAHSGCARRIFTERLAPFAAPYARRTTRLTTALTRIGMLTGGEVGARLLPALGLSASPTTLLRLVHRAIVPAAPTPRVLGVDDWVRRRGQTYGTILVDLERRVPVDLLDDRTSETLSTWLQAHPGVEIISRDRAGAYALGARAGAPDAQQVADRWHLLKNVGEVLERVLHQHRRAIDDAVSLTLSRFGSPQTLTCHVLKPARSKSRRGRGAVRRAPRTTRPPRRRQPAPASPTPDRSRRVAPASTAASDAATHNPPAPTRR